MSGRAWTEALAEPLASLARGGEWDRVEEARQGGWLLLTRGGGASDTRWFHGAGARLEALDPLADARLDRMPVAVSRWLSAGHAIRLLAWRVGSRAIFHLETAQGPRVAKLYRRDRQTLARWQVLSPAVSGWSVPRIVEWDPELKLLVLEFHAGESLNRRWLDHRGKTKDGDRIGDVLDWLLHTSVPDGFPVHTAEDEIRVLLERLEVFERSLERPPALARGLTSRIVAELRAAPAVPGVLCHRDFHDKQLLLDGTGGALLDLDLAASGHPALDVGNMLAHVRLRALKGARIPWREIASRIVARSVVTRDIEQSLHRWTAATLMRLSLIYARRRRSGDLISRLLASTEDALTRRGEWSSILPQEPR